MLFDCCMCDLVLKEFALGDGVAHCRVKCACAVRCSSRRCGLARLRTLRNDVVGKVVRVGGDRVVAKLFSDELCHIHVLLVSEYRGVCAVRRDGLSDFWNVSCRFG